MTELRESHGQELLAYAHALSLRDIPADVIDRAKACLLDAMGCGLFGSTQPWSQILAAEMVDEGSSGHSSVIGVPDAVVGARRGAVQRHGNPRLRA